MTGAGQLRDLLPPECRLAVQCELPVRSLILQHRICELRREQAERVRDPAWDGFGLRILRECLRGGADVHWRGLHNFWDLRR
jgi:hypothetical protein